MVRNYLEVSRRAYAQILQEIMLCACAAYLQVTEVDAPKLKFPEYVDFSRDLAPTAGSMPFAQVNIIMPMQHEGFRSFTLAVRVHVRRVVCA
jgi:hypothetical protein